MIQLYSFMWLLAIFMAIFGYLRGWNRELIVTAGTVLILFAIFQFDSLLRSTLFLSLPLEQIFLVQTVIFLAAVIFLYQTEELAGVENRDSDDWRAGILGAGVGFINGYLVGGTIWYFLDINQYPLSQFVTAPAVGSPSAQSINSIPLVLLGGGASGTGDVLAVGVIILLFIVLVVI